MFKKVLIPFDGLKTTIDSVKFAIELCNIIDAKLYFLYIISKESFNSAKEFLKKDNETAKKYCIERTKGLFSGVMEEIKKSKLKDYEIKIIFDETITSGIRNFAERNKIDLCVVQPSPYTNNQIVGNLAYKISEKLNIPTLFVKTSSTIGKRIDFLVPIDEKKENLKTVFMATEFSKFANVRIFLYHTTLRKDIKSQNPLDHCDKEVIKNFEEAEKIIKTKKNIFYEKVIRTDSTISEGIIKCAVEKGIDIIIMSSSKKSIIGGKPELILNHSMYPVIIIP